MRSTEIATSLSDLYGGNVKRYPEDISILGATTNEQGKLLATGTDSEFVHVELSKTTRNELMNDAGLLDAFATQLLQ